MQEKDNTYHIVTAQPGYYGLYAYMDKKGDWTVVKKPVIAFYVDAANIQRMLEYDEPRAVGVFTWLTAEAYPDMTNDKQALLCPDGQIQADECVFDSIADWLEYLHNLKIAAERASSEPEMDPLLQPGF
jgi:hypothetical protein